MDLPNKNTLKIIEERKKYLAHKSEKSAEKGGFVVMEINALDRVINLLKLFQDNLPDDLAEKITEENSPETDDDKNYDVLYSYEQEITSRSKLDISFIEQKFNSKKYIVIALKKYKNDLLKWINQGKIKITPVILEEVLGKSKELGVKW